MKKSLLALAVFGAVASAAGAVAYPVTLFAVCPRAGGTIAEVVSDNSFLTGESMAGLKAGAPTPQAITVHEASRVLEVGFSDGTTFRIPFELMRVYSPSAEVQGHGPGQEVLQTGKREVTLVNLEPVGNYAVKPTFSDGHDSGIFTWDYLYELGDKQDALWTQYTERLAAAGADRDAPMAPQGGAGGHACGSH